MLDLERYKSSLFNVNFHHPPKYEVYYNTYSGALIALEAPLESFLPEISNNQMITQTLLKQGFLVPVACDEFQKLLVERKEAIFGMSSVQLHYDIAPTLRCQAKCFYCFENKAEKTSPMTQQTADSMIAYIESQMKKYNTRKLHVTYFGGEPTLEHERIVYIGKKLKHFCQTEGIKFSSKIISNGILLDAEKTRELIKWTNLRDAQITLDGLRDTYAKVKRIDAFDMVVKNIRDICNLIKVVIRLNVSKNNCSEIRLLIEYLLDQLNLDGHVKIYLAKIENTDGCNFVPSSCMEDTKYMDYRLQLYKDLAQRYKSIHLDDLVPKVRHNFCGLERVNSSVIAPTGLLYKCEKALGLNGKEIGNVWDGKYYNSEELRFYNELPQKCQASCPLLPVCFGGCPYIRDTDLAPSNCDMKKTQLINNLRVYFDCMISRA